MAYRPAEKSEKQVPRGLKATRNDKSKVLSRWPEGQLYPQSDFFGSLFSQTSSRREGSHRQSGVAQGSLEISEMTNRDVSR